MLIQFSATYGFKYILNKKREYQKCDIKKSVETYENNRNSENLLKFTFIISEKIKIENET